MKKVTNITNDQERAFYHSTNTSFSNITIEGPADGESAFKESQNIEVFDSIFSLRYPFWHNKKLQVKNSLFKETARAPFWYDRNITISNITLESVKAFRECHNVDIVDSFLKSEEVGWRCHDVTINNCSISGAYAFFESNNLSIDKMIFQGKYSFQYINHLEIRNSKFQTKDAFWHSKNVIIENCDIEGEYLGWYSENITFKNCHIKGTQPLCYCKNIKLINCTFENCDLAFEYSEVNGNINGDIKSIKNPLSGKLVVDRVFDIIIDENDRSNGRFQLTILKKEHLLK